MESTEPLRALIERLPEGYSEGIYRGARYGITRQTFNEGRSFKIYAEELGGTDFVSLNYYITQQADRLKPCEMPEQKVADFLRGVRLLPVV